jgi:hypothetical protein
VDPSETGNGVNVFFDCDYTILSSDHQLRRGTRDVWARLVDDGHLVYLWSGEGKRWSVVRQHGLEPYLAGVLAKPLSDFDAGLRRLGIPVVPDFVIDDYPGIVRHFGGYFIPEFYSGANNDDELESVYQVITEVVATGRSDHRLWWPKAGVSTPWASPTQSP